MPFPANAASNESVWLLENKDWEYLNLDYLMQNIPQPTFMESVKLTRCKLEVTCLQYVEKMIADHGSSTSFTDATFNEVSVYGPTEQISINFSKLLSVLFHRNLLLSCGDSPC